jgi:hypothetical protein
MINRLPLDFRLPNAAHAADKTGVEPSRLRAAGEHALHKAARCIGAYPIASLATAFIGGLVFGRWVKGK